MVKLHRSKRHNKKHRGGEGEPVDNNSVLNMDEPTAVAEPAVTEPAALANEMPATPAEEEKKGWFSSLFGGSKTKRVRFRMTRKTKRSSAKRSGTKSKRSSAKRSSAKRSGRKSMRSSRNRKSTNKTRKGSSKK
jgi:hypothetical protein